jgi:hypothetical protein
VEGGGESGGRWKRELKIPILIECLLLYGKKHPCMRTQT